MTSQSHWLAQVSTESKWKQGNWHPKNCTQAPERFESLNEEQRLESIYRDDWLELLLAFSFHKSQKGKPAADHQKQNKTKQKPDCLSKHVGY